jgi:hypothetical protein
MSAWKTLADWISRGWSWCKDCGSVLKLCRFAVLTLIVGAGLLILFPQGQEALRALAEPGSLSTVTGRWLFFVGAAVLWALNAWYCCRALTYLEIPGRPPESDRVKRFEKFIPRAIGTLALLIVALSLYLAAGAFEAGEPERRTLLVSATGMLLLAGLFYAFTVFRRTRLAQPGPRARSWGGLPPGTIKTIALFLLQGLLAFVAFIFFPQQAGPFLGTHTIFLFFAATWIPLGTLLVYLAARYSLPPVLTTLLLLAVLFSFWNDNHAVRTLKAADEPRTAPSIEDHAGQWLKSRVAGSRRVLPVFFVAAEGGGIRAAYWTASVLSALEDEVPGFSRHVFAMSGVSGGSLGEAVFAALLAERRSPAAESCVVVESALLPCARRMLGRDYLSPALGVMLFPDLVQRFLPFPIPAFDRGRALEQSWERGWRKTIGGGRFADAFDALWRGDAPEEVPSLFFNSTSVESGKRTVVSNLRISDSTLADVADLHTDTGARLPLSTAAHNSARFTYVSPAGRVKNAQSGMTSGHIVDGGYFENSGTATLLEVLNTFMDVVRTPAVRDRNVDIRPIVIVIINDPGQRAGDEGYRPDRFLREALSPLRALLHTRDARGNLAKKVVKRTVEKQYGGAYQEVRLRPGSKPLPLGWMLADSAKGEIDGQLEGVVTREDEIFGVVRRLMPAGR